METPTSSGQDIRMSRRDREDRDQRIERFKLPSRERDDRPQTQTVNRGSRPRQRSPIDYDDMDRIPQGGATSSFGERRNITLRNSISDIGPSPEIGFALMNEARNDRFMPTREPRFRQPGNSPTMPTAAHREFFSPGPGNQYVFREFYRYPDEREPWVGGRSPYSRERERDRERERERERDRERQRDRDRDRTYRTSNISSHFERDSQHDPYDYRDRDYHRKRYWDYRRAGVSSGPGYRDDPHDPRYETSLSRGESGESERNGRYFMATRHNHWRQRDRRSSSPSTRSSITNSPPPPSHHRSRSTKASTRSVSPQTRSSTGNSRGSSPRRSVVSSKRPLTISIQKRNSENEDETNQCKEQVEESILHSDKEGGTESSIVDKNFAKVHATGTAIHDETNLEENSLKGSGNVHDSADEKSEGNEKGGWTGWRSIEPGLVASEEKGREKRKLSKDDAADSETVTDQTADMDLSSGENDEQPSQPHLENKLSVCTDELESMEESDAVDDLVEYQTELSKKNNEVIDSSINNSNKINNHIYEKSLNVLPSHDEMNDKLVNHPDTLNNKVGEITNHEDRILPAIPEVTHIPTSSSQYIIEGSSQLEDDKIDYNAIGAEIEKVENEIDHYRSLLDQKRKRIEEKNLARANRKSKSNKRVNFDFHQEAILIEVEQMESTLTNEQANVSNELTVNHKVNNIQNGETVLSEYMSPENDKVTNDHEEGLQASNISHESTMETCKRSTMWEIIYSENREKAVDDPFDSLIRFGSWGQTKETYKSLSEYPFYQQNILDYNRVRHMLMEDLQNQRVDIQKKEQALQQEWKTVYYAWKQKFEALQKTKGKMKQDDNDGNSSTSGFAARWPVRTNRGRRRGDVVRSEAEMEEIMKILQDEQRICQTWANIPPMILDPKERQQAKFINNNRCVSDPECFYDFNIDFNVDWTTQEREDFYELFKSFPKKFGKIAEHLKDKSVSDCVIYYYRNKKELNLKDLIPKNGRGQRMIALNSKAKKNNHASTTNTPPSGSGVMNNSKENTDEGLVTINESSEETNENIERPSINNSVETVPPIEQPEIHKHSDFNEEISEKPDLLVQQQQHYDENLLSNVQEKSKTQEQLTNNHEPSHTSIQETVEESALPVVKKTRTSKPRRKQKVVVKDSDQQEEGEPVKKKRNTHGTPNIGNNNNIPVVIPDAQDIQVSRKQNSVNDDDIGVDEAARVLTLMSLDGNAHDNNTQSSTQQESASISKGKGRPKQSEMPVERDIEASSNRSLIVNDDRITSQKKISSYWNKREVNQFELSLNEFGKDFRKISDAIRSKTEVQVKNYYEKHYEKHINTDDAETRPTTSDDIQSSQEKKSQAKSNVIVNQNFVRGNVSLESQRHNAQHQISINSQNDEMFRPGNITQLSTERQLQISETSSSLNKSSSSSVVRRSASPSETAPKSNSISLLLNPSNVSNVDVNYNWFESSGEQSSNRDNEPDSEIANDRRHSITGVASSDTNIQNSISSISRQVPPHFITQNSELHHSTRSNSHHLQQYAQMHMQQQQQIALRKQQQEVTSMQKRQQFYAQMQFQNQQNIFRQPSYFMHQQQSNQQVRQQVHQQVQQLHQQTHQQSHHQIQQRIANSVQIPAHNITSNTTPTFMNMNIQQNYIGNSVPLIYARPSQPFYSGLPSNNNTVVGQQSVNAGHHITTSTGSSSASQHNSNVSQQSSFTTLQSHQSSDYTNDMIVGQIHRVGPSFNGTNHPLFAQTPQPQVRPHHYQPVLHRVPSMTSNMNELNYNGQHHLRSMLMPSSPMQGVVGHGHAHNFTDPRPFSGDQQQQSSSERNNSRRSSPILCPKLEPPS